MAQALDLLALCCFSLQSSLTPEIISRRMSLARRVEHTSYHVAFFAGLVSVMPQPLSKVMPNARIEYGNLGFRTPANRPALAIMAMEAIATWSHAEAFMLRTYVELAGGEEADAAAVFMAMNSRSTQNAAITTLAERKLPERYLRLLRAIMRLAKSAQKERDKLAHWTWGSVQDNPDCLLLLDPRDLRYCRDTMFVYTVEDFDRLRVQFHSVGNWYADFQFILTGHPSNRDDKLFDELCREPEIAEILSRQRQQG